MDEQTFERRTRGRPVRVTALIPCHNGAAFLPASIASVRAQTRPVDEILVVDDASTDDSVAVAEAEGARVLRLAQNAGRPRRGTAACGGRGRRDRLPRRGRPMLAAPLRARRGRAGTLSGGRPREQPGAGVWRQGVRKWVAARRAGPAVRRAAAAAASQHRLPDGSRGATRRSARRGRLRYRAPYSEDYDLWMRTRAPGPSSTWAR
jgi:glycosyltransferase involved in cell wall biosynthesis